MRALSRLGDVRDILAPDASGYSQNYSHSKRAEARVLPPEARKLLSDKAEGEGLEPPRACARRISSAVPYQLGLALPERPGGA